MTKATYTKMNADGSHDYGIVQRLPSGRDKLVKVGQGTFDEASKAALSLSAA